MMLHRPKAALPLQSEAAYVAPLTLSSAYGHRAELFGNRAISTGSLLRWDRIVCY